MKEQLKSSVASAGFSEHSVIRPQQTALPVEFIGTTANEANRRDTPPRSAPMSAALAYIARGWQVFPVHSIRVAPGGSRSCSCGKSGCEHPGKHPRTARGLKDATTDAAQVRAWWDAWPDANVGIRTGAASGLLVLDIDPAHDGAESLDRLTADHGALPETVEAASGGGGTHFYFKHPATTIKSRARCAPGIDVRADGGYIIADPSNHISGGGYRWVESRAPEDVPLGVPPHWVMDLVTGPRSRPAAGTPDARGCDGTSGSLRGGIPEGSRHQRLTSLAGSMRYAGASIEAVTAALIAENARCVDTEGKLRPLPESEIRDILKAAESWEENTRSTQRNLVVRLAQERYRFGRTKTSEVFAVAKSGPMIARTLRGGADALRSELARCFFDAFGTVPSSTSLADALKVLEGMALSADPEETFVRVGPCDGGIALDLGDSTGRAVVITTEGWSVQPVSPVLFRRTELVGPMPEPKHAPGIDGIRALRSLLNASDESWPSVLAYVVAGFFPTIEHPVLMLGGEQGTGKSSAAETIGGLIDPGPCPLTTPPRDLDGWAIVAAAGWVRTLDNVSSIPEWLSDALCRAVTGDALCRRTLFTDGGVSIVEFRRVIIITSIDAGVLRGDLGSRCLVVELERIPKRRPKSELTAEYSLLRPAIVASLLDLVVGVLRLLPSVHIDEGPRLLDFARVCKALDAILGLGAFDAYCAQAGWIAADVVEGDPVALAISGLAERCPHGWTGTPTQLLETITPPAGQVPKNWPTSARMLSGRVKRATPALAAVGVEVERFKDTGPARSRQIRISRSATPPTVRTVHPPESRPGVAESCPDDRTVAQGDTTRRPANRPSGLCVPHRGQHVPERSDGPDAPA